MHHLPLKDAGAKKSVTPLDPALAEEQSALQALLQLQAREYQVSRSQSQRGRGSNSQSAQRQIDPAIAIEVHIQGPVVDGMRLVDLAVAVVVAAIAALLGVGVDQRIAVVAVDAPPRPVPVGVTQPSLIGRDAARHAEQHRRQEPPWSHHAEISHD